MGTYCAVPVDSRDDFYMPPRPDCGRPDVWGGPWEVQPRTHRPKLTIVKSDDSHSDAAAWSAKARRYPAIPTETVREISWVPDLIVMAVASIIVTVMMVIVIAVLVIGLR